jgi:hypothetical protein
MHIKPPLRKYVSELRGTEQDFLTCGGTKLHLLACKGSYSIEFIKSAFWGNTVSAWLLFVARHDLDDGRNNPTKRMTTPDEDVTIASCPKGRFLQLR